MNCGPQWPASGLCSVGLACPRGSRVCQSLTDRGLVWTTELKLGVKNTSQPATPNIARGRRRGGSSGPHRGPHGTVRARRLEPDSPVASRFSILGGSGSPPVAIGETMAAFSAATPPTSPEETSTNHLAMVTKLVDDEWLENICAEGYSTVIDGRMSFKLSVDTYGALPTGFGEERCPTMAN